MKYTDKELINRFIKANHDFREGKLAEATKAYETLAHQYPQISDVFKFNLTLARSQALAEQAKLSNPNSTLKKKSNAPTTTSTASPYKANLPAKITEKLSSRLSIAVVLHVYHDDVVDECLDRLDCIPYEFKLFVTTPHAPDNSTILRLLQRYPNAEILHCENAGRDIGPFIKAWPLIKKYDLCCKFHTKKGVSDYIEAWKHLCFQGILQSPAQVSRIVREFEEDKSLALAGPELLYGSLSKLAGNNKQTISDLSAKLKITPALNDHDGFFMGTMFWCRTKSFSFLNKFQSLEFSPEAGQKDGMIEHALERMLGSFYLKDGKILLTRVNDKLSFSAKKVSSNYESQVTTFHKHFDEVHDSYLQQKHIVGHIHTGSENDRSVSGWLALKGNPASRSAVIRIDDTYDVDLVCDRYRADLERNGINKGKHAFNATIPFSFMDGRPHTFVLIDKYSGKTVSSITKTKQRSSEIDVVRSYPEWDSARELKFIENLKKYQPQVPADIFVSVIMPTYNRSATISSAINSVLMQSFANFELIIVDDGSSDNTPELIEKCYPHKRITYIQTENKGVSNARNVGLQNATGDFIFFLDSDNSWRSNYLETMIRYMSLYRLNSAFCGLIAFGDGNKPAHYKGCDFSWTDCLQSNYVDLNAFGFDRRALFEVPLFNTKLKRLVDWDYILRIAQYNSISYAPFLGVNYYDGTNDRITNSVYKHGDELNAIIKMIQTQFSTYTRTVKALDYTYEGLKSFKCTPSSKSAPTVTTMITSYNHEKHIAQAISSVINQTGNFHHRIIISDDGSTDGTLDIIKLFASRYPELIINLSSDINVGVSANMRRCIESTQTRYLAICEGDDFWTDPRKLSKQIDFLESNKTFSMVFSQIQIKNETKDRFEILPRQQNLTSDNLTGWDFINEPTMNLIGNFSCCLFRSSALKSMSEIMYQTRLNEIAVAFHVEQIGPIGFIKELMSVYRQHSNGLWTGSQKKSQLLSGLAARQMALAVAKPEYTQAIDEIIQSKYIKPLAELSVSDPVAAENSAA